MFDSIKEMTLINPYGVTINGKWIESSVEVSFLKDVYGKYENYEELIEHTKSEGLKLFFQELKEHGILKNK